MTTPIQWLRECSRDPNSPTRLAKGALGMLTGQDTRALLAIGACWELYSNSDEDGQRAALAAVRALLPGMQPKCRFFARELIAFALDWDDRARLWPLVSSFDPQDLVRHNVSMTYEGRHLIGTVRFVIEPITEHDEPVLSVYHFNGEPWPIKPTPDQVRVIE